MMANDPYLGFDPDERVLACSESDASLVERIEINFAMPVYLKQEHSRVLHDLLSEVVQLKINQPAKGVHWLGFVGSKLNYSCVDAQLLGKAVGPNPPPNGAEPESDDTVLVFESSARSFVTEKEQKKVETERAEKETTHVDDFIDDHRKPAYARWILLHFRLPAHGHGFIEFLEGKKLFCTYEGKRYRVTGASRLGDIHIASDFDREAGYDERVAVDDCSEWGAAP
jgi:hypothetical protein